MLYLACCLCQEEWLCWCCCQLWNKILFLLRLLHLYDESPHKGCQGRLLLDGQLHPLAVSEQHWGCVGLESDDGLGFTSLAIKTFLFSFLAWNGDKNMKLIITHRSHNIGSLSLLWLEESWDVHQKWLTFWATSLRLDRTADNEICLEKQIIIAKKKC